MQKLIAYYRRLEIGEAMDEVTNYLTITFQIYHRLYKQCKINADYSRITMKKAGEPRYRCRRYTPNATPSKQFEKPDLCVRLWQFGIGEAKNSRQCEYKSKNRDNPR